MVVLVGVNGLNRPAFDRFCGDMAVAVGDRPAEIADWVMARLSPLAASAA
jgi:hypothetical protein